MFKVSQNSNEIYLSFSAFLRNIDRAAEETKRFLKKAGKENQSFNIILGLREALINAVVHGSRNNSRRVIIYHLRIENDIFFIEVEDEGYGFDWRAYFEKGIPKLHDHGRGLAIMKRYFSAMKYNERGNKLLLVLKDTTI